MFPCSLGYLQPCDAAISELNVCVYITSWYLRLLNIEDCQNMVELRGSFSAELMTVCCKVYCRGCSPVGLLWVPGMVVLQVAEDAVGSWCWRRDRSYQRGTVRVVQL